MVPLSNQYEVACELQQRNWVVPRELSSRPEWMMGLFFVVDV